MPVIVIGADTPLGDAITGALSAGGGEVRAFVSSPEVARRLRKAGVKAAVGDVSDASHVGAAAIGCFSAIVIPEAAFDNRERSFADSAADIIAGWALALSEASVQRLIWVEDSRVSIGDLERSTSEVVTVATDRRTPQQIATEVALLDSMGSPEEV